MARIEREEMKGNAARRQALLERLADHMLEAGLPGSSLRPLAAAAGTSDRMLLYYFADKNELLAAAMGVVAQRLQGRMAGAVRGQKKVEELLPELCGFLLGKEVRPYMMLWLELVAQAARGEEPFRSIAGALCDGFLEWGEGMVLVEAEAERGPAAARLLAAIEGSLVLDAIGRGSIVDLGFGKRQSTG